MPYPLAPMLTTRRAAISRSWSATSQRLAPWLAPLAIVATWKLYPSIWWQLVDKAIPALLALALVLLASRRPGACLAALFALMPYQVFIPAWLFKQGLPLGILRPLTSWRELLGIAIAVSALRAARREHRRLGILEALGLSYVVVIAAYALFPTLFAADAPTDSSVRSLAFRSSAGFVLLLLACAHAPFARRGRELADRALRATAVVVSGLAIWEFVDGSGWNQWVVHTLEVTRYQILVLKSPVFNPADVRVVVELGGREFVRVSSVMGSPLALGHFLLVPFALALERAVRGRTRGATAQATIIGTAILLTQTRSALLGAAIIVVLAIRRTPGRTRAARSRFLVLLLGIGIAASPFIVSAGLLDRFTRDQGSTNAHREGFFNGLAVIGSSPLGRGLGTSAGVGQRFDTVTSVSEDYYLQVASEAGVIAGVLFLALVLTTNRHLRRARDDTGELLVAAARSGFLGISVAAALLHAYTNQTVAWTAFGFAGLALGAARAARDEAGVGGATMEPLNIDPRTASRVGHASEAIR